jgi:hypothetical protein
MALTFACNLPGHAKEIATTNPASAGAVSTEVPIQTMDPLQNVPEYDCIAGIIPGKTNREEVIVIMGDPTGRQQQDNYETLLYASPIKGLYHSINLLDNIVDSVSIIPEEGNQRPWSVVRAALGEPAYIGYSNYEQGSMNYAYPEKGLNFVAHENLDAVFFQECFAPMSLEKYMEAYGKYHPLEDPFIQ